jgi:hypothetical protein
LKAAAKVHPFFKNPNSGKIIFSVETDKPFQWVEIVGFQRDFIFVIMY